MLVARRTVLPLALLLLSSAACAGGGAPATAAAPASAAAEATPRDAPPRFLSSTEQLELRYSTMVVVSGSTGTRTPPRQTRGTVAPLAIEVQVGPDGRADVGTLVIRGATPTDQEANREMLVRWLRAAQFAPALKNGQPIAAAYRRTFAR